MTAADYPSLDTLLTTATPVDAEPFDMEAALTRVRSSKVSIATTGIEQISRHVNAERVRTEDARRWVDRLQGECAAKDALLYEAWVVIANGPWNTGTGENPDQWTGAAIRWRDAWHNTLNLGGAE